MSVSEGQPALRYTERQLREWALDQPTDSKVAKAVVDVIDRLAREREARDQYENSFLMELELRQTLEGRVRELREALERIQDSPAGTRPGRLKMWAREALVGLPE